MRLRISRSSESQASTLVATLLITGILMITLAGYLQLAGFQNAISNRSQCWNMAIAVAEAGIEEGFAQVLANGITNCNGNGWTAITAGSSRQRMLSDSNYYSVTINTNNTPSITSIGYVQLPGQTSYVARTVQVMLQSQALLARALLTSQSVKITGTRLDIDSFNSKNGKYSVAIRDDMGDVGCLSQAPGSIQVDNGKVYGHVVTGPGGSASIGPNGSVGDMDWHANGNTGIQSGWSRDDLNINLPIAPSIPAGFARTPVPGGNSIVLPTGQYETSDLSLGGKQTLLVTGNVQLHITSSLTMAGQSSIEIATNASLTIFMDGGTATIGGNGILNDSSVASRFQYYGSPKNTTVTMTGNAYFQGVFYAPQATLNLGGGGNNDYDFIGAAVANRANLNGHFSFHYDEALANLYQSGWTITSWNEL